MDIRLLLKGGCGDVFQGHIGISREVKDFTTTGEVTPVNAFANFTDHPKFAFRTGLGLKDYLQFFYIHLRILYNCPAIGI